MRLCRISHKLFLVYFLEDKKCKAKNWFALHCNVDLVFLFKLFQTESLRKNTKLNLL